MKVRIHAVLALFALSMATQVPAADYKTEYDKKIKATQSIGVLGADVAGDQTNFYTGSTSFHAVDISVPGNGSLPVALGRTYSVEQNRQRAVVKGPVGDRESISPIQRAFGDWDWDIPYLSTIMTQAAGWAIDSTTPSNRCSILGRKPGGGDATGAPAHRLDDITGTWDMRPEQYWHGYSLHVGGSTQSLLAATSANTLRPTTGGQYPWTTNQDWWFSCVTLPNPADGEGFVARSPDGVTYTFNRLSRRNSDDSVETVSTDGYGGHGTAYYLFRAEYLLLPTHVQDRFGNWVDYAWSADVFARLLSISSSDGRSITLTYNAQGYIASASDGTRTWTYAYTGDSLTSVTLPDGSAWQYSFAGLKNASGGFIRCDYPSQDPNAAPWDCAIGEPYVMSYPGSAYVIHPSGARVDFVFESHFQWGTVGDADYTFPFGLKQKKISGPGLSEATWTFAVSPSLAEAKAGCKAQSCPGFVWADSRLPDAEMQRRVFNLQGQAMAEFDGSDGSLPSGGTAQISPTAAYAAAAGASSPLTGTVPVFYRETDTTYGVANPAYIVKVGVDPLATTEFGGGQTAAGETRLPMGSRVLKQQGVTFSHTVTSFDAYARPTSVISSSTGGAGGNFSRTETTTYLHDTAAWVLGLPKSITDAGSGAEVSRTEYNSSDLPWKTYAFGELQQTFAYNADGTLATVTDPLNHTVTLGNWYRGVPRTIGFPGGATQSATVNSDGSLATTTDELGSVSSYGYDALGRLAGLTYPTGDTVAWNPLGRNVSSVPTIEYGLAAGHWKQTVTTGSARTTTLYDAMYNPVLVLTEDMANSGSKSFVVKRYDTMGRLVFNGYPVASADVNASALKGIVTTYDALGRPYQTKQDSELGTLTTTTEYLSGFQTRVTNPRGNATTTSFQVFDGPDTERPVRIDAPQGVQTTIVRDAFGAPLSITRQGPGA